MLVSCRLPSTIYDLRLAASGQGAESREQHVGRQSFAAILATPELRWRGNLISGMLCTHRHSEERRVLCSHEEDVGKGLPTYQTSGQLAEISG